MRALLLTALCLALTGCGPSGTAKRSARPPGVAGLPGPWTGKPLDKGARVEGGSEQYLYESLGGYSLDLGADGGFKADWRGLTMEGTWRRDEKAIVLTVSKVLGKTRAEAEVENKSSGKAFNDLRLYDTGYSLERSKDDEELTLKAKTKEEETVVFRRDKS